MATPLEFRPATIDELLDRLSDAIESIDAACVRYAAYVAEVMSAWPEDPADIVDLNELPIPTRTGPTSDIAVQLRTLMLAGKGNQLLQRVADALEVAGPRIGVEGQARQPVERYDVVATSHLAVGGIPQIGLDREGSMIDLEEFLDVYCVAMASPGTDPVAFTWHDLIKQIADKIGAHADADRPVVWDHMNSLHVGNTPTIPFLMYRLGIVAMELANTLLVGGGRAPVVIAADPWPGGGQTSAVIMTETAKRPGFNVKSNDPCPCGSGKKWKRCHRQ